MLEGEYTLCGMDKGFLMPLLAVCVFPGCRFFLFLLVGLLFGAAGDILLLKSELRWCFLLGAGAFCGPSVLYSLICRVVFNSVGPFWWMVAIVFSISISDNWDLSQLTPFFLPPGLWPVPICYMLAISCMSAFSVFRFIYWPAFWPGLAMVGDVFLMASDTRLAFAILRAQQNAAASL